MSHSGIFLYLIDFEIDKSFKIRYWFWIIQSLHIPRLHIVDSIIAKPRYKRKEKR